MWRSLTNMTRDTETPSKDRNRRITRKEVAKENRARGQDLVRAARIAGRAGGGGGGMVRDTPTHLDTKHERSSPAACRPSRADTPTRSPSERIRTLAPVTLPLGRDPRDTAQQEAAAGARARCRRSGIYGSGEAGGEPLPQAVGLSIL